MGTLLLISNQVFANSDFGQDLKPVVQTKLTLSTYKKKNLTVGKVTLTNRTSKKTSKTVYGGLALIITSINNKKISIKNLSGYTEDRLPYLLIPNTTALLPKKAIKNVSIEFNNPGGKVFKFTYKIYGLTTPGQISIINPTTAASGTEITISGQNFTRATVVQMAGQTLKPSYLSHQQLKVTIPFAENNQQQILPLVTGNYPISIDNSAPYNFMVVSLPENPNAPGQVLNDKLNTSFQQFTKAVPEFQSMLPELLAQTANEPNTQKFIQGLADVANYLNNEGQVDALELMKQIDPASLDTLERLLLANEPTSTIVQQPAKLGKNSSAIGYSALSLNTTTQQQLSGDQWLENRQVLAKEAAWGSTIQSANKVKSITEWCGLVGYINPTVGLVCGLINTAATIKEINAEITVAQDKRYGVIKRIQLNISNFNGITGIRKCTEKDSPASVSSSPDKVKRADTLCQEGILKERERINLHLNNADNSEDVPSTHAKSINGATLHISNKPDWFQISNSILSLSGDLAWLTTSPLLPSTQLAKDLFKKIKDKLFDKLKDLPLVKIDNELSQPTSTKEISTKYISSKQSDFFIVQNFASDNCDLKANVSHYYLKTKTDGALVVTDVFPSLAYGEMPNVGACDFIVADEVRMPSEDAVYSQINFHLKNYPRLNLEIQGDGSVSYLIKTVSGATKCEKSVCSEFLDLGKSSFFWLSAVPPNGVATEVKWLKNHIEECNKPDCRIVLNSGIINDPPYNVLVTLNDAPIAVDDTASTGINKPMQIDVKANDYDPDSTPVGQLTIVNVSIDGGSTNGTAEITSEGKLKFMPVNGFSGSVMIKYQLVDPQGAKSNVANVLIKVTANLSDYRFEFGDASAAAGPLRCEVVNMQDLGIKLVYDSVVCHQYVTPTIKCVGEGCLENRFYAEVKRQDTVYKTQVLAPGNGSCETGGTINNITDRVTSPITFTDDYPAPGWHPIETDPSFIYPSGLYNEHLGGFTIPYWKNITNIRYNPLNPGPTSIQCARIGWEFNLSGDIYDTINRTYIPFTFGLSLP